jgi:hypothetical protein
MKKKKKKQARKKKLGIPKIIHGHCQMEIAKIVYKYIKSYIQKVKM